MGRRIILHVGQFGWDWSNRVEVDKWGRANEVIEWLLRRALREYGDVDVITRAGYGHDLNCYRENGLPDFELEQTLKERLDKILKAFVENQGFWFSVPVPWAPYFLCDHDVFSWLEDRGEVRLTEARDHEAANALYALTDFSDTAWVREVAAVWASSETGARVGDYVVCDGAGAPVRFYRAPQG